VIKQHINLIWLILVLVLAAEARAQGDLDLLSLSVRPNVVILFDNSGSMNHHMWDDDFDRTVTYPSWCGLASGATGTVTYSVSSADPYFDWTRCGVTRRLYHDNSTPDNTRYDANYLNWLFTATAAQLANEPQQTRLQAAKETMINVIDNVNPDTGLGTYEENVRFGLAQFNTDSNGGYISNAPAAGNKSALKTQIQSIRGTSWTPLSETLVDIGRYFAGPNLLGTYPQYNKTLTGGLGTAPASPMDYFCRKSFVIIVTDGEPTQALPSARLVWMRRGQDVTMG
jgi:type IV pilus assembly protein PilY1